MILRRCTYVLEDCNVNCTSGVSMAGATEGGLLGLRHVGQYAILWLNSKLNCDGVVV